MKLIAACNTEESRYCNSSRPWLQGLCIADQMSAWSVFCVVAICLTYITAEFCVVHHVHVIHLMCNDFQQVRRGCHEGNYFGEATCRAEKV